MHLRKGVFRLHIQYLTMLFLAVTLAPQATAENSSEPDKAVKRIRSRLEAAVQARKKKADKNSVHTRKEKSRGAIHETSSTEGVRRRQLKQRVRTAVGLIFGEDVDEVLNDHIVSKREIVEKIAKDICLEEMKRAPELWGDVITPGDKEWSQGVARDLVESDPALVSRTKEAIRKERKQTRENIRKATQQGAFNRHSAEKPSKSYATEGQRPSDGRLTNEILERVRNSQGAVPAATIIQNGVNTTLGGRGTVFDARLEEAAKRDRADRRRRALEQRRRALEQRRRAAAKRHRARNKQQKRRSIWDWVSIMTADCNDPIDDGYVPYQEPIPQTNFDQTDPSSPFYDPYFAPIPTPMPSVPSGGGMSNFEV